MNLKPLLKTLSGTAGYVTPLLHVVDLRGQNSTVTALSSASGTPANRHTSQGTEESNLTVFPVKFTVQL